MKRKKILMMGLFLVLSLGLSACGTKDTAVTSTESSETETSFAASVSEEDTSAASQEESTEESSAESTEEAVIPSIDLEALAAIEDPDERYLQAQNAFEDIKDNVGEHMEEAQGILSIMAQCRIEPLGDAQYLSNLKSRLSKSLASCKASYCRVLLEKSDPDSAAEEGSLSYFFDANGNFLYSEKKKGNETEKGPSYQYDAQGRLTKASGEYSLVDGIKFRKYGDLLRDTDSGSYQFVYDADGRLSSIKWKNHRACQIGFPYREDGYLTRVTFDIWENTGDKIDWTFYCENEERGWAFLDSIDEYVALGTPGMALDGLKLKVYTESEKKMPSLDLVESDSDLGRYKLSIQSAQGEDAEASASFDGTVHVPTYSMAGDRFSNVRVLIPLEDDLIYCLSFKIDHSAYSKIDFYGFEKEVYYKVPVVLE